MKAVLCPVCNGSGKNKDHNDCHGCGSRGWVEVHEDGPHRVDIVPMPYPVYPDPWDTFPRRPWYVEPYPTVIW